MNRLGLACVAFVAIVANGARGAPDDDFRWRGPKFSINAKRLPLLLADTPKPEELHLVPFLDAKHAPLSDAAMTEIACVESLTHLRLDFIPPGVKSEDPAQVTATGWKQLARLKKLRVLYLCCADLDDDALQAIGSLGELQTLSFLLCKVSPTGVKYLGGLKKLTGLSLFMTPVADASWKEISTLQTLELLEITETPITESVLQELSKLSRLRYLSLGGIKVTDTGLKHLVSLKNVTDLTLWGNQVTDVGLKSLAEMKALRTLDLRAELKVTSKGIEWLQSKKAKLFVAYPIRPLKASVEVSKNIAYLVPVHKGSLGLAAVIPSENVAPALFYGLQEQFTTALWSYWDVELVATDVNTSRANKLEPKPPFDLILQIQFLSENTHPVPKPMFGHQAQQWYPAFTPAHAMAGFAYRCADVKGTLSGEVALMGSPPNEFTVNAARQAALYKLDWSLRKDFAARLMRPARQEEREKAGWYLYNPYPFVVQGNYQLVGPLKDIKLIPFRLVPGAKPLWVDTGSFVISDLILSALERLPPEK